MYYKRLVCLTLFGALCLGACKQEQSSSQTASSSHPVQSVETEKKPPRYKREASPDLKDTTAIFNGTDMEVAKTLERYVDLTGNYDIQTFDQAEADKRLEEIKTLKLGGFLAPDEETMFQVVLDKIEAAGRSDYQAEVTQLGIFKDTSGEMTEASEYDATYQVLVTIRIVQDGVVTKESSSVSLVWTKGNQIQNSYSIADLGEVIDPEEFFNELQEE